MDRPGFVLPPRPVLDLKLISSTEDLRTQGGGAPWGFIMPRRAALATHRRLLLSLLLLLCLGAGVFALVGLYSGDFHAFSMALPAAGLAATATLALVRACHLDLQAQRNGELAAAAIRREIARTPANDRLFALVYRDAGSYLELLAFFQESGGAQRLESIRAPRLGDGSKHTETDIRKIRRALERHFSVGQINELNVVPLSRFRLADSAELPAQHSA